MMGRSRAPAGPDGQAVKPKDARGTLRRIVVIFRPYRAQLALLAVTIVVTSGLGVVNPLLIKQVFDKALFGPNKICSGVPCPNLPLLYRLVALGLAIPVVTSLIGVGQTFLSNLLGLRLMRDLRDRLYEHLQSLSMRFFTSTRTGEIQSRLTNDVAGVQSIVTDTASSILSNVVIITSSFVAMWVLSWKLTVMSLILVPLFVFFTYRVGKSRRALQSVAQQSLADLTAITEETLSVSGILLAKVFGRQRHEIARFTEENQRFTDIQLRQRMTGRYFFAVVGTFFSVTPFIVYLVAGLFQRSLTPGLVVAFTTLQARLFFPIGQMLSITTDVQSSMALFERIFEYMDLPVEIADSPNARRLAPEDVRGEDHLAEMIVRLRSDRRIRIEVVGIVGERADFEASSVELATDRRGARCVEGVHVDVGHAGVATAVARDLRPAGDLERLEAFGGRPLGERLELHPAEGGGHQAELHEIGTSSWAAVRLRPVALRSTSTQRPTRALSAIASLTSISSWPAAKVAYAGSGLGRPAAMSA